MDNSALCGARRWNGTGEPCCKAVGHDGPHAAVIVDQRDPSLAVLDYWNDRPRIVGAS